MNEPGLEALSPDVTRSDERFVAYYAEASETPATAARFGRIKDRVLSLLARLQPAHSRLRVVDIGAGAGTQSIMWARDGHEVLAIDVNRALIEIARDRASKANLNIRFDVGSAVSLPYENEVADVCLLPELLEHVSEWEACLQEAVRVLKPGGLLFLSTTNYLCPKQSEFELPAYSWYPAPIKRYCERLAVTSRPQWVNYARFPAVNWFSFFGLRKQLDRMGLDAWDRFDLIRMEPASTLARLVASVAKSNVIAHAAAHMLSPGLTVIARKRGAP